MKNCSNDYLELCLSNCLILFFQKFGFLYSSFTHFLPENKLANFLGNSDSKEFYLATTKRKNKWYFLRPEMTYVSLLGLANLQSSMCCYSGFCFRCERKQFCRFKEFLQFGVESVYSNIKKIRYMSYLLFYLTYLFLETFIDKNFLKENVVLDLFYSNDEQKNELELVIESCKNFFDLNKVSVLPIIRQGNGITPYNGITFEYHVKHDANGIHTEKRNYEFLGGGEYKYGTDYFGTGFGLGIKRLMLCMIDYKKVLHFIKSNMCNSEEKERLLIINLKNLDMCMFSRNIINFLQLLDYNLPFVVDISFEKKDNYSFICKSNRKIFV